MTDVHLPPLDDESAGFFAGTAAGELRIQRCDGCGRLRFPPRPMCPWCQSLERSWRAMSGRGAVWSYCVPHPPLLPAYTPLAPYNVVVVAIDEDPTIRLVGNLLDGPGRFLDGAVDPATIRIGEPVRFVPGAVVDGITLAGWVRA